ncbi:MAG: hypothetical protein ACK5MY_07010 [Jhaorihella sp.]
MTPAIRPARLTDLDELTNLLVADAEDRHAADPHLWTLERTVQDKTRATVKAAMEAEKPPFRQQWLVAEDGGRLVGVTHSIMLPVPPIYAGEFGRPGLLMEDCFITPGAPAGTRRDLLKAAEADLTGAGALILLASSVAGGAWEAEYARQGYTPLTMYYSKTGLIPENETAHVRQATAEDVPGIVAASSIHRHILEKLNHLFWKPHKDADTHFGAWMKRSLTLEDRDMFVSEEDAGIRGYAISQPATPLHFPTPHDITGVGVIDDFHHAATEDPRQPGASGQMAVDLLLAAERALAKRGNHSVLVVCPARWRSKIALLEHLGYHNAITWHIKMAR